MSFYWVKTHSILKKIFSKYVWDLPNEQNKVYLTFDDGPTPEITSWVLDLLKKHNAKATFFCIGKNIEQQPELFQRIIQEQHAIGNHTNDHANGWATTKDLYIKSVVACANSISKHIISNTNLPTSLFRPPYGKIKTAQINALKKQGYKIIMWDVLSADFDLSITKEKCLENVISNIQSGSIIIFHDSVKAFPNLKYTLPKVLNFIDKNNLQCATVS
ncbi:polysaccharide deacetylase family protein [Flavobacterium sp. 7A]|uniref:polysaccharide deacetylase family protein n=1 Tax=Flavobacterium sp. 7A TaxID=2940571 RepID=UPI00222803FF|nr:polysaccharide deacetylase family protein [Flavobacterium sp. 7A]MCW2117903.1 peptidoglycan/xylan/chitin deacetylase (PgdA/CDA1 family) [Flavobacterium sp. 7A]